MTTQAIEHYLYLLDAGFDGPDWHSLLSNLNTLAPEDWEWVPPGGECSIRAIVRHVGHGKVLAYDQAFGEGTLTWDDPRVEGSEATVDIPSAIAWLRTCHERLRGGIAALADDDELLVPCRTNWGELRETRWVIVVTITTFPMRARSTTCAPCIRPTTNGSRTGEAEEAMTVLDWLLDSDPAIRWQVMRDLTDAPIDEVEAERARVAHEGWGAQLLAAQGADGQWSGGALFPEWISTTYTLQLLQQFGVDPTTEVVRDAIARVRANSRWEHDNEPYFEGEVEPCINGRAVAFGAYYGVEVRGIVDRLLTEQMEDGGWNCEQENGSTRGSFDTTINVLEGLLEFERSTGGDAKVAAARNRGQEYLLARRLFRRLSTGEVIIPHKGEGDWLRFSFPNGWRYDILRGLDYLRDAGVAPDERIAEAIDIVESKRDADGRWPLEHAHHDKLLVDLGEREGEPSRWITLRALRALRWAGRAG